ncbi:unnamed protein product [Protopolystoma xenopodis]|uniref:Uncharacterized protein n=1 Tax=Protopolystoma xenopodis TaxID=117903 RepID=A0A3S5CM19_9PLAT|nr:unnamed protein product [Protopolystoma xenopodis]
MTGLPTPRTRLSAMSIPIPIYAPVCRPWLDLLALSDCPTFRLPNRQATSSHSVEPLVPAPLPAVWPPNDSVSCDHFVKVSGHT